MFVTKYDILVWRKHNLVYLIKVMFSYGKLLQNQTLGIALKQA